MRSLLLRRSRPGSRRGFGIAFALVVAGAGAGAFLNAAEAAATVTAATGGESISMDTTSATGGSGAWTTLTGPVVTEGSTGDISTSQVTLTAPSGFQFNTASTVTITISGPNSNKFAISRTGTSCAQSDKSSGTASVSAATISFSVCTTDDGTNKVTLTFSGIQVRPTASSGLPSGNITMTSGTIAGVSGSTNFGTLATVAGAAKKLVFSTQPGGGAAGTAWATQPVVTVQDNWTNTVTGSTAAVTLAIGTQPAGINSLTCTTNPLNASSGVAAFAGCGIGGTAGSYTLTASSGTLTATTSSAFSITPGTAAKLAFTTQPAGATGGTAFTTQPAVAVQDQYGNTVTSDSSQVALAIKAGTGTAGATLTCTPANTLAATSGVASFAGCKIDKAGPGYQLRATDGGLTAADSSAFTVTVGSPSKLAFAQQPTNATAGTSIAPAVTVQIQDAGGNLTTSTASVAIAIATNPAGGTLSGTTPKAAVSGTATFSDLSIDKAGAGYTLAAASSGLTGSTSTTFTISAAAPFKLAFGQQPTTTTAGVAVSPAVTVQVQDRFGNLTADTSTVTLALGSNPGSATLSGTLSKAASAGVATFSDLSITKAASGYTLTAADGSLTGATSASFTIVAAASSQLAIVQQPTNTAVATPMSPAVTVQTRDQYGNNTADSGRSITLAPSAGTINAGATTTTSGGLATFNPRIDSAAAALTLTASSAGLTTSSPSSSFTVYVPVSNGATLANTTSDPNGANGSGVASVGYFYCAGFAGACTASNWVSIGTSTTPTTFSMTWTGQPPNGQYRVVAIGTDKVGNTSGASSSIPVVVSN